MYMHHMYHSLFFMYKDNVTSNVPLVMQLNEVKFGDATRYLRAVTDIKML